MHLHPFLPVLKVELKFKIAVSLSQKPKDWICFVVKTPSKTKFQMYRKNVFVQAALSKRILTNLSERKVVFFVATQKEGTF